MEAIPLEERKEFEHAMLTIYKSDIVLSEKEAKIKVNALEPVSEVVHSATSGHCVTTRSPSQPIQDLID